MRFVLVGNGSMGSRYSNYISQNICDKSELCIIDNNPKMLHELTQEVLFVTILSQKYLMIRKLNME